MISLDEMNASIAAAKAVYDNLLQDSLSKIAENAEALGLKRFYVQGVTPGFNDGEPCTHATNIFIDNDDLRWEGVDYEPLDNTFDPSVKKALKNVLYQIDETVFQSRYGTNYALDVTFEGGKAVIKHDDYDCGY